MARGWESKSVEAQQADQERPTEIRPALTPEQVRRKVQGRTLELALARARADLQKATVAAHRRMLEDAIRALSEKIASDA
jgi:hypothetical protein